MSAAVRRVLGLATVVLAVVLVGCGSDGGSKSSSKLVLGSNEGWVRGGMFQEAIVFKKNGDYVEAERMTVMGMVISDWEGSVRGKWSSNGDEVTIKHVYGYDYVYTYDVSGNTLTLTDEYNDSKAYTKEKDVKIAMK